MGNKSFTAVERSSSILDRASPIPNQPLTEAQALTDQLVSVSIQEGTNLKTAAAMLGAGWVGRATRIGAMTSLPGQAFARGASYVPAMAAESAAFAGIERGFHPSSQPFQKDWARAAVTLTPLKVFGGLTRTQNIVVQHLFTDLGLVAGQHGAFAAGIAEKPQGPFAEQMLKAEATNWHMKGSLAFAHAFSPRLSASEKSLEIFLKSQESGLSHEGWVSPIFSQLAMAASGEEAGKGRFGEEPAASFPGERDNPTSSPRHLREILGEVLPRLKPRQDPTTTLADSLDTMSIKGKEGGGAGGEKDSGKSSILSKLVKANTPRWKNIALDPSFGLPGPKELEGLVDSARAGNKDAREALFKLDFEKLLSAAEVFPKANSAISELAKDYRSTLRASVRDFGTPENIVKLYDAAHEGDKEAAVFLVYLLMAQEKIRAGYDPALTRKSFIAELCERMPEAKEYFPEIGSGEVLAGSPQQPLTDTLGWNLDRNPLGDQALVRASEPIVGEDAPFVRPVPKEVQDLAGQGYRVTNLLTSLNRQEIAQYTRKLDKKGVDYKVVKVWESGQALHNGFFLYYVLEKVGSDSGK